MKNLGIYICIKEKIVKQALDVYQGWTPLLNFFFKS